MNVKPARGLGLALVAGALVVGSGVVASAATPATTVNWKEGVAAPFGATRFDGAKVGGKVYFLGFRASDGTSTDGSIWYYNIKQKTYVDTGVDMPVPISNYTIATLKDKTGLGLYTFGGRDSNGKIIKTVQVFYPATGTAKVVKSDPWPGKTPSGCVSMSGTGVSVVSNKAYVVGGMSFSSSVPACTDDTSAQVWSYDPTAAAGSRWTKAPSLKVAAGYVTTEVVGSKIYAIGGDTNEAGTLVPIQTVEAWKVGAKSWNDTNYADLPEACDESQAFGFTSGPLAGTITLAGCGQWPAALPDVLQYDVAGNSWSTVGALNEARRNQAGAVIGGAKNPKLFVVGGYASDGSTVLMSSEIGTAGSSMAGRVAPTRAVGSSRAPAL